MNIREIIKTKRLYFDGGTGTVLQSMGLGAGCAPESWNLAAPEKICALHRAYIDAGANIIKTNTFGVNCLKYKNHRELIAAALECAKAAKGDSDTLIAFDVGPTGRLLRPLGDLEFEGAVSVFAESIKAGAEFGADLILIETMNDSLEAKAATLAAKENCDLPVFVTCVYDEGGKLMTGASPEAMIAMLEGLGVDAIGLNCSLGPDKMLPLLDRFTRHASIPIIMNPNAGLPVVRDGETTFSCPADEFAEIMKAAAERGAHILGGCCGTTPEYIAKTVSATKNIEYSYPEEKSETVVSSYTHACVIGDEPILIGERINPTGKSKLKAALRECDMSYIQSEAIGQAERGAHILDVNVGLPEIDEAAMMKLAVESVQSVCDLPLQLDSNNAAVLEGAMRAYNGKPLINSVNGEAESMNTVFPLVKKYGGTVIALTMDKSGIPSTAEERAAIAERIVKCAAIYGISKKDIIVDPLALTVSSDKDSATVTLKAIELIRAMGLKTSLGVSNISFGLPARDKITSTFYALALERGLNCAIMNPYSDAMMDTYHTFRVLHGMDAGCADYIGYAQGAAEEKPKERSESLKSAVLHGLKDSAEKEAKKLVEVLTPEEIINNEIIPALDAIGRDFESGKAFLPQLLMSAEAASAAFDVVKSVIKKGEESGKEFIIATVKGDIHDIGKNIVKVMLESYGYTVHDLGRDVAPEAVLEAVRKTGCKLVGLSALMTTTVPAMAETIELLRREADGVCVVVGGAVLNEEYAEMIGADSYCPDAMATVRYAENYYM